MTKGGPGGAQGPRPCWGEALDGEREDSRKTVDDLMNRGETEVPPTSSGEVRQVLQFLDQ